MISADESIRKVYRYDYLGRRSLEQHFENGTFQYQRRYVYASGSFELIAEIDPSQSVNQGILRTFTRGLDNTHSLGGGGGIGGVIALDDWELQESYYLGHDGRGNVSTIHDREDGSLTGGYEYLPFGEMVRKSGNWRVNPFRFQSKWGLDFGPREGEHWPITLYDHNLRAYDPSLGRFGNRDPIGDAGGNNLYAYADNDPVNRWDYLGLCTLYIVQIWDYYSNGQYTGTEIEYEKNCGGREQQFSVAITEGSGGGLRGDKPEKEDLSHLPGCSELKAQLASGDYRPNVTAESFIPDPFVGPYHGDGREFLDAPSNPVDGSTSRISVSSTYESIFESALSGSGPAFRPVRVHTTVGETTLDLGFTEIFRTGTAQTYTSNLSFGNWVTMNVAYSGANPLSLPGAPPIRMNATLTLDFSTGQLTGPVERSAFPAAQIFYDGQSVYQGEASELGLLGLFLTDKGQINGVQVCDPSR